MVCCIMLNCMNTNRNDFKKVFTLLERAFSMCTCARTLPNVWMYAVAVCFRLSFCEHRKEDTHAHIYIHCETHGNVYIVWMCVCCCYCSFILHTLCFQHTLIRPSSIYYFHSSPPTRSKFTFIGLFFTRKTLLQVLHLASCKAFHSLCFIRRFWQEKKMGGQGRKGGLGCLFIETSEIHIT